MGPPDLSDGLMDRRRHLVGLDRRASLQRRLRLAVVRRDGVGLRVTLALLHIQRPQRSEARLRAYKDWSGLHRAVAPVATGIGNVGAGSTSGRTVIVGEEA